MLLAPIKSLHFRACISCQSDCHIGVCISVSHINQYESFTNHITAAGYLATIIAFLATGVMELGGCAQKMTLTKNLGSFDKCNGLWPLWNAHQKIEISWDMKEFNFTFCIILKLNVFFPLLTYNAHAKHIPWKQQPKSNQNMPSQCTIWTLSNVSLAWIVLHQSNSILQH